MKTYYKTIDFYKLRFKRINDLKYDINKFASYQKKRLLLHKANRLFKVNKDDFNICFLLANRNLNNSTPRYKKKALLKAKKKYQGKELLYQVKNKLYQKGFSIEEIDECLEKEINNE